VLLVYAVLVPPWMLAALEDSCQYLKIRPMVVVNLWSHKFATTIVAFFVLDGFCNLPTGGVVMVFRLELQLECF
jgi:hypothetical protein